jgi:DNA-binding transcriptional MerR regulator
MSGRYTIGEVSRLLGVKAHVLRYWESEIPLLAPQKTPSGRRVYGDRELQLLLRLRHLLHERKYTLEGARRALWSEVEPAHADIKAKLAAVRADLLTVWARLQEREGGGRS